MTAKGALITFEISGLTRAAGRVGKTAERVAKIRDRALVTLSRRLKAEAARQISAVQLNLSPSQISRYINTSKPGRGGKYISVTASNTRLPLRLFGARASKASGVTVTTWRSRGQVHLPHAFLMKGEIYQRAPYRGQANAYAVGDGLVNRLPLAQLKGPSLKRTLQPVGRYAADTGRDEVVNNLLLFGQAVLSAEIRRLEGVK